MRKFLAFWMLMVAPLPAQAVTTSISSTFTGAAVFAGDSLTYTNNQGSLLRERNVNGYPELLDTSAVLTTDGISSFFFKHDSVVTAAAAATARTQLTIEVTNDNEVSANLRFDSQIIPGHVAVRRPFPGTEGIPSSFARIDFGVQLDGVDLYRLTQELGSLDVPVLDPEFSALNDLRRYAEIEVNEVVAYDWWYSNINLELGVFAPGETKTLVYDLFTLVNAEPVGAATDPFPNCPYAQLSFGDPRARGQTMLRTTPGTRPGEVPRDGGCDRANPITRLAFDPAAFSFSIVPSGSPIPGDPLPPPPIDYLEGFAVPEPAALALFGLGALAALTRRRSRTA